MGLFPYLGKTPGHHVQHLCQVFVCHWLSVDQFLSLHYMSDYDFFSKSPNQWREAFQSLWGHHDICPLLDQFHVASIMQSELSFLTSLKLEAIQKNSEQYHLSPGSNWGVHGRGQSIWPFYDVCKPLSGQGLHHGGSSQTTGPTDPHWV